MVKRKRPDRRVQRTRQLLQDALMAMMIEKGYEATTVQDIIDRANVGRATFYAHFADKETLLASRLEDLRAFLVERQRHSRGLGYSLAMLEHARDHLPVYTAIVGRARGGFVVQRIHAMIADLATLDLRLLGFKGGPEQRRLAAQFIAGAFMAVLIWWLDHGATVPPQEVDGIVRRLVMRGLAAELGLRT
jgi:AcrR family transcriptional regulator